MKKLILVLIGLCFLTACPNEKEITEAKVDFFNKKSEAYSAIMQNETNVDALLKVHEYAFNFGEKVHMMKVDAEAKANILALVKNMGAKKFCSDFIIGPTAWKAVTQFCEIGGGDRCSVDMTEYLQTFGQFLDLVGNDIRRKMSKESSCN